MGFLYQLLMTGLNDALGQHSVGNFNEAGDVGAFNVVDPAIFFTLVHAGVVDVLHDAVQALVNFTGGPIQTHGVLAHL